MRAGRLPAPRLYNLPVTGLLALALSLAADAAPPDHLRCEDERVGLRRLDVERIRSAVARRSGYPLVRIERPDRKKHRGAGVLEVQTLIDGVCTEGGPGFGEWFLVRRGRQGWEVLKLAGRWYKDVLD